MAEESQTGQMNGQEAKGSEPGQGHKQQSLEVRIHGTRGSLSPIQKIGPTERYGRETTCVELRLPTYSMIIDAGTGIRNIDPASVSDKDIYLCFSHTHGDHINGLGFFASAYDPTENIKLLATEGHMKALHAYYNKHNRLFPVSIDMMIGVKGKKKIKPFEPFEVGDALVTPVPLNHPQDAYGYIINVDGKKLAMLWDVEHERNLKDIGHGIDRALISYMHDADLVIADAQYTPKEYDPAQFGEKGFAKAGFGHSADEKMIRLAECAGAKNLLITHHDPMHNDAFLDKRLGEIQKMSVLVGIGYAKEGDVYKI